MGVVRRVLFGFMIGAVGRLLATFLFRNSAACWRWITTGIADRVADGVLEIIQPAATSFDPAIAEDHTDRHSSQGDREYAYGD